MWGLRAVDDFVFIDGAAPAGEVLAVEDAFKAIFANPLVQRVVGLGAADFPDVDVSKTDFRPVGLQFDRTAGQDGPGPVEIVVQDLAVDGQLVVEPDPHTGPDHPDVERVPRTDRVVGLFQGPFAGIVGVVVPERP